MKRLLKSVDELHEMWLDEMSKFAWAYQTKTAGGYKSTGYVMTVLETDFDFRCDGIFELPPGSAALVNKMAQFARCTLYKPTSIEGADLDDLPIESTFCLKSLLIAAYPKDLSTNVFKPHDCAIAVGDLPSPEGGFRAQHCAFGGLGVVLMDRCRKLIGPLTPAEDVLAWANEKFLSIVE